MQFKYPISKRTKNGYYQTVANLVVAELINEIRESDFTDDGIDEVGITLNRFLSNPKPSIKVILFINLHTGKVEVMNYLFDKNSDEYIYENADDFRISPEEAKMLWEFAFKSIEKYLS